MEQYSNKVLLMYKYDYVVVGCGLFGSTFVQQAIENGKKCLIIDKRNHIAGNCYTEKTAEGIDLHKYGPHIFHTNSDQIWTYVNRFTSFNSFVNRPKVNFKDNIYSFPINLFTLYQLWGIKTPSEAKEKLENVKIKNKDPKNLEEWILNEVGEEIYHTFIYGYTKKQWGRDPKDLPSFIIRRLPIRLSFDDNYFMDKYQGIPENGYTEMISNMISGCDTELGVNYFKNRDYYNSLGKQVIYTGPIDEFFDYEYGQLDYRSLSFETSSYDIPDFQGNAIINYTDSSVAQTRIVEHKHFHCSKPGLLTLNKTYITKEYPINDKKSEPFYPVNDSKNSDIAQKYKNLYISKLNNKFIFGGRLAEYKYYDMHQIIGSALNRYKNQ